VHFVPHVFDEGRARHRDRYAQIATCGLKIQYPIQSPAEGVRSVRGREGHEGADARGGPTSVSAAVFDARACLLGEGPMWHPSRQQFFWFDVIDRKLLSQAPGPDGADALPLEWRFTEHVSCAGWLDHDHLFLASETSLSAFDIRSGRRQVVALLEADDPATRSNDGRVDLHGGFWVGTMGKSAQPGFGAIYRYFRGECRRVFGRITIPNSICFSPDGDHLYYADTPQQIIRRQALDAAGWPTGEPETFIDLRAEGRWPDGSVVDSEGALWNAQWGSGRVARYRADGRFDQAIEIPGLQSSCPAFGGGDLSTLLITSARQHLAAPSPYDGLTYRALTAAFRGIAEPCVQL
jgi:sugar lactone lactonase YvrE